MSDNIYVGIVVGLVPLNSLINPLIYTINNFKSRIVKESHKRRLER